MCNSLHYNLTSRLRYLQKQNYNEMATLTHTNSHTQRQQLAFNGLIINRDNICTVWSTNRSRHLVKLNFCALHSCQNNYQIQKKSSNQI